MVFFLEHTLVILSSERDLHEIKTEYSRICQLLENEET